jgi:hypothetical protein
MVRKECLEQVGGFDERLPARQDYDLWLRISRYYHFDFISTPLAIFHWEHVDRIAYASPDKKITAMELVLEKVRSYLVDEPVWVKRRSLAAQYYTVGRTLCSQGHIKLGIGYLLRAIFAWPLEPKTWAILALALGGAELFQQVGKIKRRVRSRVYGPLVASSLKDNIGCLGYCIGWRPPCT